MNSCDGRRADPVVLPSGKADAVPREPARGELSCNFARRTAARLGRERCRHSDRATGGSWGVEAILREMPASASRLVGFGAPLLGPARERLQRLEQRVAVLGQTVMSG